MECLDNFIGISERCVGTPASKSGKYIEDFEGFSVKSLSLIEGGKYLTVQAMLNAKLRIAGEKITEVLGGMLGDVYIEDSVDSLISKNFDDLFFDQQDGIPGLRIEKYPTALSYIFIPFIYFKSDIDVNGLVITISDGFNLVQYSVDALAGEEVSIQVDYSTGQQSVDITYNSSIEPSSQGVAPYKSNISVYRKYENRDCGKCSNVCGHRYLKIHGLDFNGVEQTSYYGIRADIQLRCDREKMVCLIAPNNKTLIFYYAVIEILNELIAGDRFNFLAMNSKEWAKEKKVEIENKIAELWDINGPGIKNLLTHSEKKCFKCTGTQYYERVP
jgi:hypothetical protein